MQLRGRDHGRRAAVHVIADPTDCVLGGRPFTEYRMDMPVHKTRHHRAVARIECGVSSGVCRRVEFDDALALNQYRLDRLLRVCKFTSKEFADVFDQKCSQRPLLLVRKLLSPRNPSVVDGQVVVQNRKVITIDDRALQDEVAELMGPLLGDLRNVRARLTEITPYLEEAARRALALDIGISRYIHG
jgi:hypothetical protein